MFAFFQTGVQFPPSPPTIMNPKIKKFPTLKSRRLALNKVTAKDLPFFVRWLNDPEVNIHLNLRHQARLTLAHEKRWLNLLYKKPDSYVWALRYGKNRALIGSIGLHRIDLQNRTADIGIAISNKEYWGKGLGPEAIKTLLRFAFGKLKLNNVMLWTDGNHRRANRAYRKVGFKKMGIRRNCSLFPSSKKPINQVYYDITREDFYRS